VYNHVHAARRLARARAPAQHSLSKDGKTWYASLVLEDSPVGQYSYPSVIQSADGMNTYCVYWAGTDKIVEIDPANWK